MCVCYRAYNNDNAQVPLIHLSMAPPFVAFAVGEVRTSDLVMFPVHRYLTFVYLFGWVV